MATSFESQVLNDIATLKSALAPFYTSVTAYGATGNGVTDDSATIQAAIDAVSITGGVLFFPPGVYNVSRYSSFSYCLNCAGSNITFMGVKGKSWLRLAAGSPATSVSLLRLNNGVSVTVRDMGFDGNWGAIVGVTDDYDGINHEDQTPGNASNHGLVIRGCTDVHVDNCLFKQCYGDGIWVGASAESFTTPSDGVRITNCDIQICARDGIALAQRCKRIQILNTRAIQCLNQAMDFEPIGLSQYVYDVTMDNCYFGLWWNPENPGRSVNSSVSIVGGTVQAAGPLSWARRVTLSNSTIEGSIIVNSVRDVQIVNNHIIVDHAGFSYAPIMLEGNNRDVLVSGNTIFDRANNETTRHEASIDVHHYPASLNNAQPHNITIENNVIECKNGRFGIKLDGVGSGAISTLAAQPDVTRTASAALVDSVTDNASPAWSVNQWLGWQVRIGTAYGTIVGNTAGQLTVDQWTDTDGDIVATPSAGAYTIFMERGFCSVRNNVIEATDYGHGSGKGILLRCSRSGARVEVVGNKFRNVTGEAIRVESADATRAWKELEIANNRAIDDQPVATTTSIINFSSTLYSFRTVLRHNSGEGFTATHNLATGFWIEQEGTWVGFGTPEGVVTSSIGGVFKRLDGGASTTLYIKTSGTGNTGWTAK